MVGISIGIWPPVLWKRSAASLSERRAVRLEDISARYQDYKGSFYRKCTPEYTAERLKEVEEVRTWLLSNLRR